MSASNLLRSWHDPSSLAALNLAQWDLLLRQADRANLTAALYYLVARHGLLGAIPQQVRARLQCARVTAERHRQAARWEVSRIRKALAPSGIPLILLKGGAYVAAGTPTAEGRMFSDIDILVPKERMADAETALIVGGWVMGDFDEYDQRYYRHWMHEIPPMRHVTRQTTIDVHHAILPETAAVRPDPALLRAAAVPVNGQDGVFVLAPADMVLHSAVHLFSDGEFDHGLRDLVDIDGLLRLFGTDLAFWATLSERAVQLQLERPLFYALRYARLLLATPVPDVATGQGRPPAPLLMLMDQLFRRALLPMHPSCSDWLTGTARFLIYLRGNWLRMPPLMLARHLFHKAFISPQRIDTEAA